jgi:hypothetical protein
VELCENLQIIPKSINRGKFKRQNAIVPSTQAITKNGDK